MKTENFTSMQMKRSLDELDKIVPHSFVLIIGGGGAMVLAHKFPLSTADLDAVPQGMEISILDPYVKKVAEKLSITHDWLNPYFASFVHVLPSEYGERLVSVFQGKKIHAKALGKEDLLIMKCFAGRQKDVSHARALIKNGANMDLVEAHIHKLEEKRIPGASKALEFLHEQEDWIGDQS